MSPKNAIHQFLADGDCKKFMEDDPLVVPAHPSLRLGIGGFPGQVFLPQMVHHRIVKFQKGEMELGDRHMNVVALATDQRFSLGISG